VRKRRHFAAYKQGFSKLDARVSPRLDFDS
jgi:hypothetical protein